MGGTKQEHLACSCVVGKTDARPAGQCRKQCVLHGPRRGLQKKPRTARACLVLDRGRSPFSPPRTPKAMEFNGLGREEKTMAQLESQKGTLLDRMRDLEEDYERINARDRRQGEQPHRRTVVAACILTPHVLQPALSLGTVRACGAAQPPEPGYNPISLRAGTSARPVGCPNYMLTRSACTERTTIKRSREDQKEQIVDQETPAQLAHTPVEGEGVRSTWDGPAASSPAGRRASRGRCFFFFFYFLVSPFSGTSPSRPVTRSTLRKQLAL